MTTPFDVYLSMLQGQQPKQAADALVPGHVGMGINSGHQDSDGAEATNSALARNRADMQAMALISGTADGGAGYSTPPPATSPSLQMQADIKAATVIDEAIKFAEYVYNQTKQAYTEDYVKEVAAEGKGLLAQGADMAWHNRSPLGRAGVVAGGLALAGGAAYAGHQAMQPAPQPVSDDALKVASAVLEALGLQALPKEASMADSLAARLGYKKMMTAQRAGEMVGNAATQGIQAAQRLAANPVAQVVGAGAAGAGAMAAYDRSKKAGLGSSVGGAVDAGVSRGAQFLGDHKATLGAGAAGLALGTAGGGATGFAAGAWSGHQAAAAQQAAQAAMAQEAGQARPADASLSAMKEASLYQAAEMGRQFALQHLGVAQ